MSPGLSGRRRRWFVGAGWWGACGWGCGRGFGWGRVAWPPPWWRLVPGAGGPGCGWCGVVVAGALLLLLLPPVLLLLALKLSVVVMVVLVVVVVLVLLLGLRLRLLLGVGLGLGRQLEVDEDVVLEVRRDQLRVEGIRGLLLGCGNRLSVGRGGASSLLSGCSFGLCFGRALVDEGSDEGLGGRLQG